MATVNFSAADRTLYAHLAGGSTTMPHKNLRIQLDEALVSRTPETLIMDFSGVGFMDSLRRGADPGPAAAGAGAGGQPAYPACPDQLRRVLQLAQIPCNDVQQKEE